MQSSDNIMYSDRHEPISPRNSWILGLWKQGKHIFFYWTWWDLQHIIRDVCIKLVSIWNDRWILHDYKTVNFFKIFFLGVIFRSKLYQVNMITTCSLLDILFVKWSLLHITNKFEMQKSCMRLMHEIPSLLKWKG